jgi:hypothetical protein
MYGESSGGLVMDEMAGEITSNFSLMQIAFAVL